MGLFGKKKEPAAAAPERGTQPGNTGILVLGSGCAKCNALEEVVRAALTELGMDPAVGHVTDFTQIAAYGVMSTPALVVDGQVVSSGKVLKPEEVVEILKKVR
mgnify:CR=1 FL=1